MKANELMIGDWVSYYKPDTGLMVGRIKKLNVNKYLDGDDEIEVVDSKGCWMTIPDINELQPIPLTAEILEKNGFIKRLWDIYKLPQTDVSIEHIGGLFYLRISNMRLFTIQSVSHLQHALRLFGTGKVIKLED